MMRSILIWSYLFLAVLGAVLTPSTDPVTMLLLSGAITGLYLVGVGLVALAEGISISKILTTSANE